MTYLQDLASEIRAEVAEDLVPPDSDALFLMYAVLARGKPEGVTAEDVHDAWVAWMAANRKTHASMVPFENLPMDVKAEDTPFVDAITAVQRRRRMRHGN